MAAEGIIFHSFTKNTSNLSLTGYSAIAGTLKVLATIKVQSWKELETSFSQILTLAHLVET